jgi:hypothetical protein
VRKHCCCRRKPDLSEKERQRPCTWMAMPVRGTPAVADSRSSFV